MEKIIYDPVKRWKEERHSKKKEEDDGTPEKATLICIVTSVIFLVVSIVMMLDLENAYLQRLGIVINIAAFFIFWVGLDNIYESK